MKGKVLLFDRDTHKGIIEDKNQNRYSFHIGEWLSEQPIIVGEEDAINIR